MKKIIIGITSLIMTLMPVLASAVTLQVWNRNGLMAEVVSAFNEKMEEEGKDIRAEFTVIPYEEQQVKFITALVSQTSPDVYGLDLINFPYFNSIGAFVDITDQVAALSYKDQLNPGMSKLGMYQGKTYAIPLYNDNSGMLINKALFKEAGIKDMPKTWDDVLKYAKQLTKEDQYGMTFCGAVSGMTMFTWLPHLWMNGGDIGNEDRSEISINSQEAVKALEYWTELIQYAPPGAASYGYGDYYNGFTSGKIGMMFGGSWHVAAIQNDKPLLDFEVIPFPASAEGKETRAFMGGDNIAISSQSKHPQEAWEFVKFATSKEVQLDIIAKNNTVPGRLDIALNNEYFDEEPRYYVFAKGGQVGKAPFSTKYSEETAIVSAAVSKALAGGSPKQMLDDAAAKLKKLY